MKTIGLGLKVFVFAGNGLMGSLMDLRGFQGKTDREEEACVSCSDILNQLGQYGSDAAVMMPPIFGMVTQTSAAVSATGCQVKLLMIYNIEVFLAVLLCHLILLPRCVLKLGSKPTHGCEDNRHYCIINQYTFTEYPHPRPDWTDLLNSHLDDDVWMEGL